MEKQNIHIKYEKYSNYIKWLLIIAGVSIMTLPFIETTKGHNIAGFHSPYSFIFATLAALSLVSYVTIYFINEHCATHNMKEFNLYFPAVVTVIAIIVFVFADKFFVNEYLQSNTSNILDKLITGRPKKLAWCWGPLVYCSCMAAAAYYSYRINIIINEMREETE